LRSLRQANAFRIRSGTFPVALDMTGVRTLHAPTVAEGISLCPPERVLAALDLSSGAGVGRTDDVVDIRNDV
jgi:hypothetical protein